MHPGATAARSNITVTVRCTVAIASASIGAHVFRGAVDRLFHDTWGSDFILQLVLSTLVLSVFWSSLVFVFLKLGHNDSGSNASASAFSEQNPQLMSTHPLTLLLLSAAFMALILALTAWAALEMNDAVFYSRSLAWIPPLIWFQDAGFSVASRLFPCRLEGSDLGCEPHKWIPAFLLSNAAAYFPLLLVGAFVRSRSAYARLALERFLQLFVRWGTLLAGLGLALRLLWCQFSPNISSPIHAWDTARISWTLLDGGTGVLCLALLLTVPLHAWKILRAAWKRSDVEPNLVQLTWLASFCVVALLLGDQFRS